MGKLQRAINEGENVVSVIHPGFTEEEAAELLEECERAGIKLKVKYLPPQPKWVSCNVL